MADVLVVASKVKAVIAASELRTSADFIEALSKEVETRCADATVKAKAAGHKTVMAEDLKI